MTTHHERQQRVALQIAQAIQARGYRVFLAESGTYGFFTDAEGSRVVSFQTGEFLYPSVSGNYVTDQPRRTGTGWRIADDVDEHRIADYFAAYPPPWAVQDSTWRFATLQDHLKRYGDSSRYTELPCPTAEEL